MKSEVKGLKVNDYWNEQQDCQLSIYCTDTGIHIVNADLDTELSYHWIIDENGIVKKFEVTSPLTDSNP